MPPLADFRKLMGAFISSILQTCGDDGAKTLAESFAGVNSNLKKLAGLVTKGGRHRGRPVLDDRRAGSRS